LKKKCLKIDICNNIKMKLEEIENSNKLIAEFMGYTLITPEMRKYPEDWKCSYWENPEFKGSSKEVLCSEKGLSYDCSWNWLMSVVEKIRNVEICSNFNINVGCDSLIETEYPHIEFEQYCNSKISTLEAVYITVVNFIKWYNEKK
jgi:hypothetical protein